MLSTVIYSEIVNLQIYQVLTYFRFIYFFLFILTWKSVYCVCLILFVMLWNFI